MLAANSPTSPTDAPTDPDPAIIYHANCVDGLVAAACVYNEFGKQATYHPANYNYVTLEGSVLSFRHDRDIPQPTLDVTGLTIYIVDFSLPLDLLCKVAEQARQVVVLDHHKTARDNLQTLDAETGNWKRKDALPENVHLYIDMERSGGMIAWDYSNPSSSYTSCLVEYTGLRDLYRHKDHVSCQMIEALHLALLKHMHVPLEKWAEWLQDNDAVLTLAIGDLNTWYWFSDEVRKIAGRAVYKLDADGARVALVNCPPEFISEVGYFINNLSPATCDYVCCYGLMRDAEGLRWTVYASLRATSCDVAVIAQKYGGGGHAGAAGFGMDLIEFLGMWG